jgi:2'-5' RNA ligase
MMIRLFVAIDLPASVKAQLLKCCTGVPGAKWVKPEQMHLTLRFIGEVDEAAFETIRQALAVVTTAPFSLSLNGAGQFPPKGGARVLWVGLDAPPTLFDLQRRIEAALNQLGYPPETRPFAAHITLARLKSPPPPESIRQFLSRNADLVSDPIPVTQFVLYSSQLAPSGPTYTAEATYPLKT